MHYQLEINNIDYLKSSFAGYGALLVENNPSIVWTSPAYERPLESFLWYPIELGDIPCTFEDYIKEKLAETDHDEAQYLIYNWNNKHIKQVNPKRQFEIGDKRFLELKSNIVLTSYCDLPAHRNTINAGSGYLWWYIPKNKLNDNPDTH